jgi:hypothetical protein
MSTRKHSPRTRDYRPAADMLETRQLLSGVVTGMDPQGDTWTLRLIGPGSLTVVKQVGADGKPTALNAPTEINQIIVGGTLPGLARLVGTVKKAAGSDGRVFFQEFDQLPGRSEQFPSVGDSLKSIVMPGFWLGNTTPGTTAGTPVMKLPDGVMTLQFGGVDMTHNRPAATSTTTAIQAVVAMGLPKYGGTNIIIDRSISTSQQAPPASGSTTPTTVQFGVLFEVGGRLSLFQANSIVGDKAHPPGQFSNQNANATGKGGTIVYDSLSGTTRFNTLAVDGIKGSTGGSTGYVRVGGDATNFTTVVEDPTGSGTDHIANFFVGGEATNVMLVAPSGSRAIGFGKGMDTVEIRTHTIDTLKANRGALNSTVVVDRQIGHVDFGGDVVNSKVLAGTVQNFTTILNDIAGQSTSIFATGTPSAPPLPTNAQPSGEMTVHVAGDITNSVFAASVQPFNGDYSSPNALVLPTGVIHAKHEGVINNATVTPEAPGQAFYAQKVDSATGPVTPPHQPEPPYAHAPTHPLVPGLPQGATTVPSTTTLSGHPATLSAAGQARTTKPVVQHGQTTPKGPRTSLTTRGY